MKVREYKTFDDPYLFSNSEFDRIKESDIHGGVFTTPIIPVKRQTWLTQETLKHVTAILHYIGDAWALRTGWQGDPCAGHIGTAYCPFVSAEPVQIRNEKGESITISPAYIHPIQVGNTWVWRVEYRKM